MQYFVTQTIYSRGYQRKDDTTKVVMRPSMTHIPCFSLADAEGMCELLSRELLSDNSRTEQSRTYEVSASVFTSKGRMILSFGDLQGIAEQFNNPQP